MSGLHPFIWFIQIFIFLLGVAVGHSFMLSESTGRKTGKRSLNSLFSKAARCADKSWEKDSTVEDALYNARVRQEIDDI